MKKTIGFVLALMLSFSGCRKTPKPTPEPKPHETPKIQSFVSPTAEKGLQIVSNRGNQKGVSHTPSSVLLTEK